jgi:hypothetical protein
MLFQYRAVAICTRHLFWPADNSVADTIYGQIKPVTSEVWTQRAEGQRVWVIDTLVLNAPVGTAKSQVKYHLVVAS